MKILAIGDPHGRLDLLKKIPKKDIDLILLTGDLAQADLARKISFENLERRKKGFPEIESSPQLDKKIILEITNSTIAVLKYLSKFAPVYTINGNICGVTRKEAEKFKEKTHLTLPILTEKIKTLKNVHLVSNQLRIINNVRIGFLEYFKDTNWIEDFKPQDYKENLKRAKKQTAKAKKILQRFNKLDILVHHQPPYKILDKVGNRAPKHWQGKHAGSKTILEYIKSFQPTYTLCGHIHEGEGKTQIGKTKVYNLGVAGYKIIEI